VRGEITAVDGATLTVTAEDGTQTSVTTTDETSVTHTEVGDVSDLQVGDTVTVMGSGGEDDSSGVTALAISEGESMTMGAGFPGGAGGFTGERPDGFPTDMPGGGFPGGPDGGGAPEAPAQG
jgi:hypothetical protein